jgi:hypothetical protein
MTIQVLLIAAAAVFIVLTWRRERSGQVSRLPAVFWSLVWLALIVVAVWPEAASLLARTVGVGRGADAVLYLSVAALFWLVFRLAVRQRRTEGEITRLVRELALKDFEKREGGK